MGAEAARLVPHMHGDLLPAMIEQPHQPGVPAGPHRAAQILGRHRVIGFGHFDVAIAIDLPLGFVEEGNARSAAAQRRPLDFVEHLADLLLGRAVNPRVGDGALPVGQEAVLPSKLAKTRPFSPLFFTYLTPASTFPLCRGM